MDFSEKLKAERQRLGLTQQQMADLCGVRVLTQANYEKGSTHPKANYLKAAATLGVDVESLFDKASEKITSIARYSPEIIQTSVEAVCVWLNNNSRTLSPQIMGEVVLTMCALGSTPNAIKKKAPEVLNMLKLVA